MQVIRSSSEMQQWRAAQTDGQRIGFVPTMGHLHIGHQSLLERSRAECDITVLSVFVNPTQFNQRSDYELYPTSLASDLDLATTQHVAVVFAPTEAEMYPGGYQIQVSDTIESGRLEGAMRPGHFTGMLTVVLKLLQLVRPTIAYFGEKDYQQLKLVQKLAQTFFLPTHIQACETVRYPSGLPYSSRNSRLCAAGLEKAHTFAAMIRQDKPLEIIKQQLLNGDIRIDYLEDIEGRRFAAVWIDGIRLIDNFSVAGE